MAKITLLRKYRGPRPVASPDFKFSRYAMILCLALIPTRSYAQWWTAAPADYEDCAERAQKSSASSDVKAAHIADCDAKFAARRKPGGGYTYYDFMQNRSFDIAGPNPTQDEQKKIDEQYTVYLDSHRRSIILAAFAEKQRQQQMAALETSGLPTSVATVPQESKPVIVAKPRPRPKPPTCTAEPLVCGWSKLSASIKAIFSPPPPPAKVKRT